MSSQFWKSILSTCWCFVRKEDIPDQSKTAAITTVIQSEIVPLPPNSIKGLSDLNDVCLEKIFWYLNYDDLLNMVLYDKHFRVTAKKVFLQKYLDEYVVLSNVSSFHSIHNGSEMERTIQLLDLFGDVITNLCIRFKLENIGFVIDAVNRRCGKNIRKLKLNHMNQERMKCVRHEVGTLAVNKFLKCINKSFPNLHELHLIYGSTTDVCPYWYDVEEMVIPSLIRFTIDGRFVFESFRKFIGVNASIENLCVKCLCSEFKWNIGYDFVPFLDKALPQLKYLEVSVACYEGVNHQFGHRHPVYLQQLKTFKSVGHTENMWRPNFYQFAGTELVELELDELIFEQESLIHSISHFKQLSRITVETVGTFSTEKKIRFENRVNEALTNEKSIKVIVRRKELIRKPTLDLHRFQFQRKCS